MSNKISRAAKMEIYKYLVSSMVSMDVRQKTLGEKNAERNFGELGGT